MSEEVNLFASSIEEWVDPAFHLPEGGDGFLVQPQLLHPPKPPDGFGGFPGHEVHLGPPLQVLLDHHSPDLQDFFDL